jgi:hypothetical protein
MSNYPLDGHFGDACVYRAAASISWPSAIMVEGSFHSALSSSILLLGPRAWSVSAATTTGWLELWTQPYMEARTVLCVKSQPELENRRLQVVTGQV